MENWKSVIGYEGFYEISDRGRVRSVTRTVNSNIKNNTSVVKKGKMLKMNLKKNGYLAFDASKENKVKTIQVHQAVANAFIPNPENKKCVNHKNADKIDNRIENLEWVTYKENMQHASCMKLFPTTQSKMILCVEENKTFKNSVEAAKWICAKNGYTKDIKCVARTIRSICTGVRKRAYGYRWKDIDCERSTISL